MFHPKSCRCESCCPNPSPLRHQDCSHNWKNRFCKLRKQWSEHSKCGSRNQHFEDCNDCRSPCDQAVGKFGIAWVAEIPNCDCEEPRGWQIEINDTPPNILKKCKQLIKWLNDPPKVYDSIEGNNLPCKLYTQKCVLNTCEECCEDTCGRKNKCHNECSEVPDCCQRRCGDNFACSDEEDFSCNKREVSCSDPCQNVKPKRKSCLAAHCRSQDESSCDESNSRPHSRNKCHWSHSPHLPNDGEIFRKETCCCKCQDRYYKNTGTTYEIDIVPHRENHHDNFDMNELDSKIVCPGIRTSAICKKLKEDKRNHLIEHNERELHNSVISGSIDDKTTSLYVNNHPGHYSNLNTNMNHSITSGGSQRRSSKFRRKESM